MGLLCRDAEQGGRRPGSTSGRSGTGVTLPEPGPLGPAGLEVAHPRGSTLRGTCTARRLEAETGGRDRQLARRASRTLGQAPGQRRKGEGRVGGPAPTVGGQGCCSKVQVGGRMEGWTEGARAVPRGVSAQLPLGQGAQGPGSREGRCWLSGQAPGLCRGPGTSEQAGGTLRASARRRCRLRGVCGISEQGEHTLSLSSFTHRRGARPGLGRMWSVGLGGLGLPPGRGDAGPGRAEGSRPGFCFRSGGGKKRVWPGRCRPGHPAPEPPSHPVGLVPPPLPEAKTVQMLVLSAQGQERQARGLRSANQTPLPGPCAWACIVYPEEQGRLTPAPALGGGALPTGRPHGTPGLVLLPLPQFCGSPSILLAHSPSPWKDTVGVFCGRAPCWRGVSLLPRTHSHERRRRDDLPRPCAQVQGSPAPPAPRNTPPSHLPQACAPRSPLPAEPRLEAFPPVRPPTRPLAPSPALPVLIAQCVLTCDHRPAR